MNKQIWGKYMDEASKGGNMGVGFPAGTLTGPTDASTADVHGLQWIHTPTADTSHPVTISIYKASSNQKAADFYQKMKTSDWKEWPENFPDHGNDYQDVDHCGIKTSGTSGLAVWTQDPDKIRGCFLVVLTGGTSGATAFDAGLKDGNVYPDGIYMVVYSSAKDEKAPT